MTQRYGVPQPRLEAAKNKFINKKYLSFPMSEWKHGAVLVSACLMHLGSASGWLSRSAEFGWAYIWGGQVAVCWSRPASSGDWTLPCGFSSSRLVLTVVIQGSKKEQKLQRFLRPMLGTGTASLPSIPSVRTSLKARTCGINSQCKGLESKQATSYSSL